MKLRKVLTGSAAFVGLLALTFINGPQASASPQQCNTGKFCIWADLNYTGTLGQSQTSQGNLTNMDNKTTSFWNRTGKTVTVYNYANYVSSTKAGTGGKTSPYCVVVRPGAWYSNMNTVNPLYNDSVSSFEVGGTCTKSPVTYIFESKTGTPKN
ncbi:peptidase inhibitor family I36 protein [Streptomyces sp. NPDC087901]|uniref:peptidase inhibitor family I36 protein n=1 Tax=Streptomyces sp. NPDC087901 TaxID=3365818 RepID=UPI0037F72C28